MKIGQYKQMNNHLTRKATPEERKKLELKNQEELKKRIAKKRSEYGLPPGPVKALLLHIHSPVGPAVDSAPISSLLQEFKANI